MSNRPGYSNVRVVSSRPVAEQGYYEDDRYYEVRQERGPVVRRDASRPRDVREVEYEVERDYVEGGDRYYTTSDRRVTRQSPQQRVVTESAYSSRVPRGYTNTNVSYVSPRLYGSGESDLSDDDVVYEDAHHFEDEDQYDFPAYYYDENRTTTYAGATSALDYIDERRSKSGRRKWNPICDMGETPTYWLIRCEIPGVRKDRLQVAVEGKDLIIKGKRVKELWNLDRLGASTTLAPTTTTTTSGAATTTTAPATATKFTPDPRMSGVNWINKERGGKGTFKRRVRLPERVDDSAIQALYKDGILEVLVKKPEVQARKQAKAAAQAKAVAIQHS